ncbi:hypothetical protein RMATCC62417_13548 [Rhizopus microsporus]|nr:hypothetical protein RMATCC62417_13548 [Rhizopus microsporus]
MSLASIHPYHPQMSISSITHNKTTLSPYSTDFTLDERKERNKAASARYRVKKNAQYHEMKHTIQEITTRNKILETQIKELKEENKRLRSTTDKLRSQLVANKMLNKWIKNHHNNGFMMDMDSFQDDDLNCCLLK